MARAGTQAALLLLPALIWAAAASWGSPGPSHAAPAPAALGGSYGGAAGAGAGALALEAEAGRPSKVFMQLQVPSTLVVPAAAATVASAAGRCLPPPPPLIKGLARPGQASAAFCWSIPRTPRPPTAPHLRGGRTGWCCAPATAAACRLLAATSPSSRCRTRWAGGCACEQDYMLLVAPRNASWDTHCFMPAALVPAAATHEGASGQDGQQLAPAQRGGLRRRVLQPRCLHAVQLLPRRPGCPALRDGHGCAGLARGAAVWWRAGAGLPGACAAYPTHARSAPAALTIEQPGSCYLLARQGTVSGGRCARVRGSGQACPQGLPHSRRCGLQPCAALRSAAPAARAAPSRGSCRRSPQLCACPSRAPQLSRPPAGQRLGPGHQRGRPAGARPRLLPRDGGGRLPRPARILHVRQRQRGAAPAALCYACAVPRCAVLCCAVLCCAVLCCDGAVLCCAVLRLRRAALCCAGHRQRPAC